MVEYVQSAGGKDAILKKARKGEALKAADDTRQADDGDFNQEKEPEDDADDSSDANDDLFDEEQDASLRLGPEELARVLSEDIAMNEVFYLECRKTGFGPNGIRIEGRVTTQNRSDRRRCRRRPVGPTTALALRSKSVVAG